MRFEAEPLRAEDDAAEGGRAIWGRSDVGHEQPLDRDTGNGLLAVWRTQYYGSFIAGSFPQVALSRGGEPRRVREIGMNSLDSS